MKTRAFIVEDQGMFRMFLEQWVAGAPGFEVAGSAASGEEALAMFPGVNAEVMIIDLQLPGMDGLEFLRAARVERPDVKALVLSSLADPLALTRVRESGANGYLEKNAPPRELLEALEVIVAGGSSFSNRYQETLDRERNKPQAVGKILSRREQEVLTHVLAGKTSREIADLISLSPRTVEFHRSNIMGKLAATNVAELVAHARQLGLG